MSESPNAAKKASCESGFVADGQARLLEGIHSEAKRLLNAALLSAKTPSEELEIREKAKLKLDEQIANLDSPYNAY